MTPGHQQGDTKKDRCTIIVKDFVSDDSKKSGLGEFKDIHVAWIASGGVVGPILIASVTKIILKKMNLSNQNGDKSEENLKHFIF